MATKREWVSKVFQGHETDRVPVGFWHHFTEQKEWNQGFGNLDIFAKNLAGHQQFLKEVQPDFIKLMSDGYFTYPNPAIHPEASIEELQAITSIGEGHPWFQEQVNLVKEIKASFSEDILALYNIFAPATYLKWQLSGQVIGGDDKLADLLDLDAQTVAHVLEVIAKDIAYLSKKIIIEADIDGIYLSVQSVQDPRVSSADYHNYIRPSDLLVLEAANQVTPTNVLHICGYEGAKNPIDDFADYPAPVVNWAVASEGLSLAEGKALFKGKTVLGGFANGKEGILYSGSKEEIEEEVARLLKETGRQGLIIGADCTVPADIDPKRLVWVKEAVAK